MGQDFNFNGITPWQNNVNAGPIATGYDAGGNIQMDFDTADGIQRSLDYSKLNPLQGAGDFSGDAQRVADALYGQATSRLDPQYQAEERKYAASLAAKGVSENSEAYRRAMDDFSRRKTDAYNQANWSAIGAGGQEQSRLFGLSLAQRQQGVNEVNNQGQFVNAAQAQQFGQNQAAMEARNQAQYQQNAQNAAAAAFGNTAQGQIFGQGMQNANLNNAGRQQGIQEATYLRNLPLQDIQALMGAGGGVQDPNFQDYNATSVADTDYSSLVQNNYNNQMQAYQAKLAQKNAALGAIFGTAGKIGSAAIMASDRRVKEAINAIGKLANGIKTYTYRYIGDTATQFGVMADEVLQVRPEAVLRHPSGYLMVDYGKVW